MSHCPNFLGKMFYSAVATEHTNSPCTNVPMICPLCPSTSAAVWKYSMKIHLMWMHPSTEGGGFHKVYMISDYEKASLKLLWDKREKCSHQHQKHDVASTPLAISEVHSSWQAFFLSQHPSSSDNDPANNTAHKLELIEDKSASSSCGSQPDSSTRSDQNGNTEDSNQDNGKTSDDDSEDKSSFTFTLQNQKIITIEEHRVTNTPEKHRTPQAPEDFEDSKSLSEPRITHALTTRMIQLIMTQSLAQSRQDKKYKGPLRHLQMLVSVNQMEFTIEARPTRSGCVHRTRDMVEITACICGSPVESKSRNSNTAVQCGYKGSETFWPAQLVLS
ncbi:hypothetical protein EI94DRAFT_1696116 [Lactarius quietus]|nr:hypothetical protein EI94DRAFT_1696116 [Lactarius quietus]